MTSNNGLRVRKSINLIWQEYQKGNKQELTDLIRAWKGICDISQKNPDAPNSFFKIGGMHGEPFRGAGYGSAAWWGGYCNHGNVLFPTWHRAYCLHIEDALRSIPACENVTLPYWDETGEDTKTNGVPGIFLQPTFPLDGEIIDNPLYSYKFPQDIKDRIDQDPADLYTKPKGYHTVRYPYSGLVGTTAEINATNQHNQQFTVAEANQLLSDNVKNWLGAEIHVNGAAVPTGTRMKFSNCLHAPNYTVFSNTTSAGAWNELHTAEDLVIPLESPHNDIHLAVGGFDITGQGDFSPIPDANGDMGENDTAGLDPIFFFHHCEIDRYFWLWQQLHQSTEHLEIIPEFPGTNSVDSQGPTPGVAGGTWLAMESDLQPFTKPNAQGGSATKYLSSNDVVNIEKLGYTYAPPNNNFSAVLPPLQRAPTSVRISGVNKNQIAGSHQLLVYATLPGASAKTLVATESVLSRWHTSGCANCQLMGDTQRYVPLHGLNADDVEQGKVDLHVEVVTRAGRNLGGRLGDTKLRPKHEVIGRGGKVVSGKLV